MTEPAAVPMPLSGKTALVTGTAAGIGKAIAWAAQDSSRSPCR